MGVKVKERIKGSGVFWIFIDHNGRRKAKKVGSEAAARKAKAMIEARLVLGNSALPEEKANPTTPTLEEYYKTFEKTYLKTVRFSTRSSYEGNFRVHVLPELGKLRLDEISRQRIQQFISTLLTKNLVRIKRVQGQQQTEVVEKKLAKDSIRLALAALSVLFSHAQENGVVQHSPITRLGKFYRQAGQVRDEIQPLTAEEVPIFLNGVMALSPEYFPLFLCAIHTGMRSGEIAGLQWGDIDLNGKFLMVRRSFRAGRTSPTKTSKVRRVDVSDDLLTELKDLNKRRKEQCLAQGQNEVPEWVFCNSEGNPADMQNIKNRHFFKCLEKAKLRRIRFHDLRHTFASLLIQNGESLAYVKEQLGHSSIKMTVDVYGHLVPGANRQAVNRLPALKQKAKADAMAAKS